MHRGDALYKDFYYKPPLVELESESYEDILEKYEPHFCVFEERALERKDYPTGIIEEIEETYEQRKREKKESLFERLRNELKIISLS